MSPKATALDVPELPASPALPAGTDSYPDDRWPRPNDKLRVATVSVVDDSRIAGNAALKRRPLELDNHYADQGLTNTRTPSRPSSPLKQLVDARHVRAQRGVPVDQSGQR
jgi:hypothetical protein